MSRRTPRLSAPIPSALDPRPTEQARIASSRVVPDADLYRAPVGPGSVHVERYGYGGPAVVLLHGLGTSAFLWRRIAPALAVRRMTAFAIDLFGHGESDRETDAEYGITAQAGYLERALTALRLQQVLLVGMDFGAHVALRTAWDFPDRVSGLVLVGMPALDAVPAEDVRLVQAAATRSAISLTRGAFGASQLLAPLLRRSVAKASYMPDRLVGRYLAAHVGPDAGQHFLALSQSITAEDVEEIDLERLAIPTSLVRGASDPWSDGAALDRLSRVLKAVRTLHIDGVGRLVPEEAPDRLLSVIAGHPAVDAAGHSAS